MWPDLRVELAAVLRGSHGAVVRLGRLDPRLVCEAADAEGVTALLHDAVAKRATLPAGATALVELLREKVHDSVVVDLVRMPKLGQLLDAFQAAGIDALLMKGAHLAQSHYPRPDLRPRLDADVLIDPATKDAAMRLMRALGYDEIREQQVGDLLMYQRTFVDRQCAVPFTVDLHWRALNPQVFSRTFPFQELRAAAVRLPGPGRFARGLGPEHALLLACVHPIAHHDGDMRLIWLYDIHLLASRFDAAAWRRVVGMAAQYQLLDPCRHSLRRAMETFWTLVPARPLRHLDARSRSRRAGRRRRRGRIATVAADLRALPLWRDRARLLGQYLFPPPDYMRTVYAPGAAVPLPLLYLLRALRGVAK